MYKKSLRAQMRIHRTGNHSVMPAATGRIDLIPAWAEEPEEYYNALRVQYENLRTYLADMIDKITPLNEAMKRRMPHSEYQMYREAHDEYGHVMQILQEQLAALAPVIRAADECSRDAICWHLAKGRRFLDAAQIEQLGYETDDLIRSWRDLPSLRKHRGELAKEKHDHLAQRDKIMRRRKKSRDRMEFRFAERLSKAGKKALRDDEISREREHMARMHDARGATKTVMTGLAKDHLFPREDSMADKLAKLKEHFAK